MNNTQPAIFFFLILLFSQSDFSQTNPELREETKSLVRSNTEFALTAYAKMGQKEGNIFFSPLSLSYALTMVLGGAKGLTADQIAETLQLNPNQKNLHAEVAALLTSLTAKDENLQLFIANALWGQKGLQISDTYQNLLRTHYKSSVQAVDFAAKPQMAASAINAWVKQNTNDRIKNLVQANSFSPDLLFLMTNAVYFRARWAREFYRSNTTLEDFWLGKDQKTRVNMMKQKTYFRYFADKWGEALEMPYHDGKFSMIVLLPKERNGLTALEKQLNQQSLENWIAAMQSREVEVFFPKFELEANLSLNEFLSNLGMPLAFQDNADFSGITKNHRKIKLGKAIQKTFIRVDEEGTEAVALTMATGVGGGIAMPKELPPVFRADHPFIFLIRDRVTNSILFLGRYMNPDNKVIDLKP